MRIEKKLISCILLRTSLALAVKLDLRWKLTHVMLGNLLTVAMGLSL